MTSTVLLPVSSPQAYRLSSSWLRLLMCPGWRMKACREGVFPGRERNLLAEKTDPLAGRVKLHAPVFEYRLCFAAGAAEQGADTCLQFAQVERFAQVIVGAVVEAGDLVCRRVAGGQQQDRPGRHLRAFRAGRSDCPCRANRGSRIQAA